MAVVATSPVSQPAAPSWTARDTFRIAPLATPEKGSPGFVRLDPDVTGIPFANRISESRHLTNQVFLNGSGVAAGDVDGDGLTDLVLAGFDNPNALYRNLGGWRFEDIGQASGVDLPELPCTGVALADLNGNGALDLIVNTLGQGTHILFNDGRGRFTRSSLVLNTGRGAMSIALADVDGDGFLDLYLVNYRTRALMDMPNTRMTFRREGPRTVVDTVDGKPATDPEFRERFVVNAAGGIEENGEPDVLYLNQRGSRFVAVPWTEGQFLDENGTPLTGPPLDWGLTAMFRDLNGDGRPDLYVCNDFQSPDRLWLSQGDGRFRLAPPLALRRTSLSSMAVDFADLNRDGIDDFLVLDMRSRDHGLRMRWVHDTFPHRPAPGLYTDRPQIEQNTLFVGRGDGSWTEIAQLSGLEATEWAWGCVFLDVDLDGWEDLLVVNGMERAGRDLDVVEQIRSGRAGRRPPTPAEVFASRRAFPRLATPNLAFRNRGDLTFADASTEWGFDLAAVSHGLILADLDNDGALDVVVGNLNEPVALYRNRAPAPRLAVRLRGTPPNTRAIGSRIDVLGGPVPQSQEMIAGGRYLSSDDPIRTFAAGTAERLTVRVRWPNGTRSEWAGIPANSLVELHQPRTEPGGPSTAMPTRTVDPDFGSLRPPIRFERVRLDHRHADAPFDDLARQPLLSHALSQPGPGIAWIDLDGDGADDLVIGAGRGGTLGVFRHAGADGFVPWNSAAWRTPMARDVTGLVPWPRASGAPLLLAALSHYEDGAALGAAVVAWDPARPAFDELVPADASSVGPLAVGDIDGDGQPDLFVGGRVLPGRWPAAASSRFFRNDRGRLVPDPARSRILENVGLVTGAVFTDLDGDGTAELVLACEWGPLRVFRRNASGFTEITADLGLAEHTGWWTAIAAGDFDNDGRMDLVAGNWGCNTPYQFGRDHPGSDVPAPLRVYHGDFNRNGVHDLIEAYRHPETGEYVPLRQRSALEGALPALPKGFPTHRAFGEATLPTILGPALARTAFVEARWLESTLFLNRGDRFEAHPLPLPAQLAPVFGIVVADANGDGHEDLFLAQNFFAVRPHLPRYDGGLGLWLAGDGTGRLRPVPAHQSGVRMAGEQRGAAVADFDGDGRVDLAVGQNSTETHVYRNVGAVPGLRLRLSGPSANPAGIGARYRWIDARTPAPMREVHAGSGWLSHSSLTHVLARPPGTTRLHVFWPGERVPIEYVVPADLPGVILTHEGDVQPLR